MFNQFQVIVKRCMIEVIAGFVEDRQKRAWENGGIDDAAGVIVVVAHVGASRTGQVVACTHFQSGGNVIVVVYPAGKPLKRYWV